MSVGERDPKFYCELKQLNEDFLDYLKSVQEKSPYFDFSPTVKSYVKQVDDLLFKFPEKLPDKNVPPPSSTTTTTTLSSSSSSSSSTTTTTTASSSLTTATLPFAPISSPFGSSPIFGSSSLASSIVSQSSAAASISSSKPLFTANTQALSSTTPALTFAQQIPTAAPSMPFLFGASSNPTSSAPISSSNSSFSFTLPKKEDQQSALGSSSSNNISTSSISSNNNNVNSTVVDNNSGAEDDAPPPEPKIEKYEEPDAKYSVKCKLYEKVRTSSGQIDVNLMGVGSLFVKALDTPNKLQVIVRQEPDLRRVLLNEVITPNIPVKMLPKAIQLVFPGVNGDTQFYIVKVRAEKESSELYEMLNLAKT